MMEKMKQPGVYEHGRIGQVELAREFLSSSVYAYPCHFEEISCISAMKAQVAGCIPLTTDYAALAETNLTGFTIKGNPKTDLLVLKEFQNLLVSALCGFGDDEERARTDIAKAAWKKFSWTNVAKQWTEVFSNAK